MTQSTARTQSIWKLSEIIGDRIKESSFHFDSICKNKIERSASNNETPKHASLLHPICQSRNPIKYNSLSSKKRRQIGALSIRLYFVQNEREQTYHAILAQFASRSTINLLFSFVFYSTFRSCEFVGDEIVDLLFKVNKLQETHYHIISHYIFFRVLVTCIEIL